MEKVKLIRERLKTTQSRQKSYAGVRRRDLEFEVGDLVYLKISPMSGVKRFGKKGKLSLCYVGTYKILSRVGKVVYEVELPSELSSVHLILHVSMSEKQCGDESNQWFQLFRCSVPGLTVILRACYSTSSVVDENAANKDAGREDDFKNENCSDLEALEDEIMAYEEECSDEELGKKNILDVDDLPDVNITSKEDINEVKLKNHESIDVTDGQDEVGGTVTDSIQAAIDEILFSLSTPSTTKSIDVGASSKMTERRWDLLDSQIPPVFPDSQVQELQASKENAPAKQERKKSRVLRSPYISKYGSGSKDSIDFDKEEKLKYDFDGYTINQDLPNELMIDYFQRIAVRLLKTHSAKKDTDNHYRVNASGLGYSQLDFVVAYPQSNNWFYLMSERKTCWNDNHLDMIFYHLIKKSKIQLGDIYRYTTTSCFFKSYVEKPHTRYYPAEPAVELSTQQDYTKSIVVAKNEDSIANIIYGFCMPAGLPWYMVDEVYVPINCGKEFYWVLAVIVLKERLIRVYDSLSSKRKKEPPIEIQKLEVMLQTYLSDNGFYDKTKRTDWPSLETYKEKITLQTGLVNEISFDVD
ncbi:hypothetical protein CQW23_09588 [Capsicum baccatum]|uniref:Ubiquitin-like protease family profile domain-containing protein n=1 Tax=Capsicum baccatum TaxID=33114 RepID=A0A2G2WXB7_CAPBA|nr:hypothetical protein CQW23_09588 [Capsicum baccatum]